MNVELTLFAPVAELAWHTFHRLLPIFHQLFNLFLIWYQLFVISRENFELFPLDFRLISTIN